MGGFLSLLAAYLLGGLTLIPLLGLAFYVYTSTPFGDPDPTKLVKTAIAADSPASAPPDESSAKQQAPTKGLPPRYGWLTARKTFKPRVQDKDGAGGGSAPASPSAAHDPAQPSTASSYSSLLLRSVRPSKDGTAASSSKDGSSSSSSSSATPQATHTYVPPPEFFFAALKGSILYLYTSETLEECHAVLDLQQHDVTFYPVDGLMDGEIYAKRNSIHLKPRRRAAASSLDKSMAAAGSLGGGAQDPTAGGESGDATAVKRERSPTPLLHPTAWFLFVQSNIEMEDWYLALKHASSEDPYAPTLDGLAPVFSEQDMTNLIAQLDFEPDQIPMRWFNAIFGRIFLGINRTAWLENFIKSKLHKKLHRLTLPSFLSPLTVTQVSLSSPPPTFSRPMLKDLTPQGEASMEVFVAYPGELRVSVTTTATLSLGSRFKSYQVPLVLAVIIKDIEGDLRVRVKGAPSNRLWYGFSGEPKMTINVEPVVSATQIKWSLILKPIEKQLREVFHESVVLPNMDDIPWFDTTGLTRGGIFADAARRDAVASSAPDGPPSLDVTVEPPEPTETLIGAPTPSLYAGSLRKRQGTTSSIESTTDGEAKPDGHGIARTETAPSNLEHTSTGANSSSLSKKTWFGGKPIAESIKSVSLKSLKEKDEQPVKSSAASQVSVASSSDADAGARGRAASVPPLKVDSHTLASSPAPVTAPREHPISPSKGSLAESLQAESEPATSPTSANLTAASVVTAWRNRNSDKQALTNLGLEARNAAKKWGANWASKRKGGAMSHESGSADEGEHAAPAAADKVHQRGTSAGSSKDLFERLSAQLATPAADTTTAAATSSSQPSTTGPKLPSLARTPSPGKGVSPTRAMPATQGPTTALSSAPPRDLSPASTLSAPLPSTTSPSASIDGRRPSTTSPSASIDGRRPSTHAPVRTQMGASKMMAIPGIPAARRSAEQSFSSQPPAPAPGSSPEDSAAADARSVESGSSVEGRSRLGSMYRLFGSVSGAASAATGDDSASSFAANLTALEAGYIPTDEPTPSRVPPAVPSRPAPSVLGSSNRGRSTSTSTSHPVSISVPSSSSASLLAAAADGAPVGSTRLEGAPAPSLSTSSSSSSPLGSLGAQANLKRIAQLDRDRVASTSSPTPSTARTSSPSGPRTPSSVDVASSSQAAANAPALPPRSPLKPPPLPPRTPSSQSLKALVVDQPPRPPSPPTPTKPSLPESTSAVALSQAQSLDEAASSSTMAAAAGEADHPPVTRSRSDSETQSVDGLFAYDEH